MAAEPTDSWEEAGGGLRVALAGDWTTEALDRAGWPRRTPKEATGKRVTVDMAGIGSIDSNGSLAITRWIQRIVGAAAEVEVVNAPPHLETIAHLLSSQEAAEPPPPRRPLTDWLESIGRGAVHFCATAAALVSFLGEVTVSLARNLMRPAQVRGKSVVFHMQQAGVAALPIVGLLSFLIGVVTAYQGADQLARFGAEIYTVNVVGVGVLREMGALIAAIVVAGRSASAFAAQIGTMKINEEVDALRVIGIDPMAVLVVPRVLALVLIFPFLVVYANAMGVLGGAIMATIALDISFSQFASQFQAGVPLNSFWIGLSKAPLFAGAIAGVGCYQGLQVRKGAAAVGEKTTAAVVQAIFLVIVIDALMSIVYSILGL